MQHGTRRGYGTGCRCHPCRTAESDYRKAWIAARDWPPCDIQDCDNRARTRGLCGTHYTRLRRHGDPEVELIGYGGTIEDRMFRHVDASGDCWEWTGAKVTGYGVTSVGGKQQLAHRAVWEWLVGPVPDGLELDHLCRNRRCVNPDHLEPVTHAVNLQRSHLYSATRGYRGTNRHIDHPNYQKQKPKKKPRSRVK